MKEKLYIILYTKKWQNDTKTNFNNKYWWEEGVING